MPPDRPILHRPAPVRLRGDDAELHRASASRQPAQPGRHTRLPHGPGGDRGPRSVARTEDPLLIGPPGSECIRLRGGFCIVEIEGDETLQWTDLRRTTRGVQDTEGGEIHQMSHIEHQHRRDQCHCAQHQVCHRLRLH